LLFDDDDPASAARVGCASETVKTHKTPPFPGGVSAFQEDKAERWCRRNEDEFSRLFLLLLLSRLKNGRLFGRIIVTINTRVFCVCVCDG
jgi:hypothetical protein